MKKRKERAGKQKLNNLTRTDKSLQYKIKCLLGRIEMNERKAPIVFIMIDELMDKNNEFYNAYYALIVDAQKMIDNQVNLKNYKEHLLYTLFIAPTEQIHDGVIPIDTDSIFIPVYKASPEQFKNMTDVLLNKIKEHITDDEEKALLTINQIIKNAFFLSADALAGFSFEVKAYLTRD